MTLKKIASVAAVFLLAVTAAYGAADKPNVVFILIDALRADHLSCYGYERETSPNIDALAAGALVFKNHKAQSSYTRTSMASIFTSRYTSDANLLPPGEAAGDDRTMAELLKESGYFNVAIVTNPQLQKDWGYGNGFDVYRMEMPHGDTISLEMNWWMAGADKNYFYADAAHAAEVFEKVLVNQASHENLFIYVHLMETHEPYIPPEEHQVFSAAPLSIKDSAQLSGDFISRKEASLKDAAVDLYDAEVHFADAAAGRIVAALKERGIYDDTVVIVASDHGEEFLEHGGTRHANGLYEEVIHVPLIVSIPGREGVEWTGLTRNVDIAPTILGLAGRAEDWPERDGVSLIDVVEGRVSPTESVARLFLDNNNTPRSWDAIQSGDAKLIDARLPNFHYTEMFDLRSDPAEKADLFESRAKEAAALAERLAKARGASRERAKAVVDDETSRAIKAIGYN